MRPTILASVLASVLLPTAGCGEQATEQPSPLSEPADASLNATTEDPFTSPSLTGMTGVPTSDPSSPATVPSVVGVGGSSNAAPGSMSPTAAGGGSAAPVLPGPSQSAGGAPDGGGAPAVGGSGTSGMAGAPGEATGGAAQGGSGPVDGDDGSGGGDAAEETCAAEAPALDPSLLAMCSGSGTLECVFGGSPGHYDVSFLLGGDTEGTTSIAAESRRFMFPPTVTEEGASRCVTFTVNVREPEGQPIQDVSAGTPGLNFLLGPEARVRGVGMRPAVDPIVVYIAGDSTVCDQSPQLNVPAEERFTGWGQMLPQYFGPGVSVTNFADSGESTAAFRPDGGGLWARIADQIDDGDYLLIQLGHNDKTTPAATYASRVTAMVQYAKGVGATPVLFSPIARNTGGTLDDQHIYGDLVVRSELADIARAEQVVYVDLTEKTFLWMQELGRTAAQSFFVLSDQTHTNELGADLFAKMVVEGMIEENVPLTTFLR